MKNFKTLGLVVLSSLMLLMPSLAHADSTQLCGLPGQPACAIEQNFIFNTINKVFTFFLWIIIAIVTIMLLYAAFLYVWARGDGEAIGKAKHIIVYCVVGLIVAALAYAVPTLVKSIIGQ